MPLNPFSLSRSRQSTATRALPDELPPPAYAAVDQNPVPATPTTYAPPSGPPPGHMSTGPADSSGYPSSGYHSSHGSNQVPSQYPPQNSAPYPPGNSAPYPPANSSPYPPVSGTPYPPLSGAPASSIGPTGTYPPQGANGVPPSSGQDSPPQRMGSTSGVSDTARQGSLHAPGGRYREDPLDLLKTFDTVLIVDDSGSMQLTSTAGGLSRWEEARDALAGLVALVKDKDPDGIDVHFLNSSQSLISCTDPNAVRQVFDSIEPDGATPTGAKIEELMMEYLDAIELAKQSKAQGRPLPEGFVEPRKRNYIIITDGAPSDDLEDVIISIARRLDQSHFPLSQVGFSFIQVGDDPEATEALQELDDTISSGQGVRDIVDTTMYKGMTLSYDSIVKALLGGINRRFDRKG